MEGDGSYLTISDEIKEICKGVSTVDNDQTKRYFIQNLTFENTPLLSVSVAAVIIQWYDRLAATWTNKKIGGVP